MRNLDDLTLKRNERAAIQEATRILKERFPVRDVILFGSKVRGDSDTDSDIDLLVVAKTDLAPRQRYCAVRRLIADVPASFDIIVKTPEEYNRWRSVVNHIVYFADKYGRILYER